MSENDYIAEYIKEKYPKLLGMDYTVWKMGRLLGDAIGKVVDAFSSIDWQQAAEYTKEHTEKLEEEEGDLC